MPKVTVGARKRGCDRDRWGGEMQEGKDCQLYFSYKGWGLFKMKTACGFRLAKFREVQLEKAD